MKSVYIRKLTIKPGSVLLIFISLLLLISLDAFAAAELSISVTACRSTGACPGSSPLTVDEEDEVRYCFTITNTGDAAVLDLLLNVDFAAPGPQNGNLQMTLLGPTDEDGDGTIDDLAPGASVSTTDNTWVWTLSAPGTSTCVATVSGTDATSGDPVEDADTLTITINDLVAELTVTATACLSSGSCPGSSPLTVDEEDEVRYCFTITNTGDAAVLDLLLNVDFAAPGPLNGNLQMTLLGSTDEDGDSNVDDLAPGASVSTTDNAWVWTLSAPGTSTCVATASGTDATSGDPVEDADTLTITINDLVAELKVTKTVTTENGSCPGSSSLTVDEWDTVKYCYEIENIGDATATGVTLVDDNGTPGDGGDDFTVTLTGLTNEDAGITPDDLAPGGKATGFALVSLYTPGSVTNTATATASDMSSGGSISDDDSVTVTVDDRVAELKVTKTVTTENGSCPGSSSLTVDEWDTVKYCYEVENIGDATATGVTLVDDNGTPGDGTDDFPVTLTGLTNEDAGFDADDLAPGGTASGFVLVSLYTPGSVTNTATATATDRTSGGSISDDDSVTVTVDDRVAELKVTKSVTTSSGSCPGSTSLTVDEWDTVKYCYEIENIGDATATGVTLVDDNGTPGDGIDDIIIPLTGLTNEDAGFEADDLAPGGTASGFVLVSLYTPGSVTNTATATATDRTSGGSISDDDSVTVNVTNVLPTLHDCPSNMLVDNDPGLPSAVVGWTPPTATDPSGVPPTLTSTHSPGDTFPFGATTVTYTATDAHGGQATCSFNVVVTDNIPPIITISTPQKDGIYTVGSDVVAEWTVTSNVGLASAIATEPSGDLLDTSRPGSFRFRVTATDITGLTTTETVEWCASYVMRPAHDPSSWTEEWLCIDRYLPLVERMLIGSVPLSGVYAVGDTVQISFALCDARDRATRDSLVSLSITRANDPDSDVRFSDLTDYLLRFYSFRYDRERGGFFFEFATWGYQPGYYDLWIAVNATLLQRVRILIVESSG